MRNTEMKHILKRNAAVDDHNKLLFPVLFSLDTPLQHKSPVIRLLSLLFPSSPISALPTTRTLRLRRYLRYLRDRAVITGHGRHRRGGTANKHVLQTDGRFPIPHSRGGIARHARRKAGYPRSSRHYAANTEKQNFVSQSLRCH